MLSVYQKASLKALLGLFYVLAHWIDQWAWFPVLD